MFHCQKAEKLRSDNVTAENEAYQKHTANSGGHDHKMRIGNLICGTPLYCCNPRDVRGAKLVMKKHSGGQDHKMRIGNLICGTPLYCCDPRDARGAKPVM